MASKIVVLDSSAVLAWFEKEPGAGTVQEYLENAECHLSSVNLAEIIARGSRISTAHASQLRALVLGLSISVVAFDEAQATACGLLESITRKKGLSLGDRACLALAQQLKAIVLTTDRAWLELELDLSIINIRE